MFAFIARWLFLFPFFRETAWCWFCFLKIFWMKSHCTWNRNVFGYFREPGKCSNVPTQTQKWFLLFMGETTVVWYAHTGQQDIYACINRPATRRAWKKKRLAPAPVAKFNAWEFNVFRGKKKRAKVVYKKKNCIFFLCFIYSHFYSEPITDFFAFFKV